RGKVLAPRPHLRPPHPSCLLLDPENPVTIPPMNPGPPRTLEDLRAFAAELSRGLDPNSRYLPELLAILDAAKDPADFERRLLAGCRGLRHAGPDVFAAMSLREKVLANLVTPETTLFRFTEGEMEALDREILPRLRGLANGGANAQARAA